MVKETYPVFKGGVSLADKLADLKAQGCEIVDIEKDVPVSHGEGCPTEIGDRIVVNRYSREERERRDQMIPHCPFYGTFLDGRCHP